MFLTTPQAYYNTLNTEFQKNRMDSCHGWPSLRTSTLWSFRPWFLYFRIFYFCIYILYFRGYIPIIWMDHLLWSHIVGVSGSDIRTPVDIVDIYRGYSQPWKRTEARSSPLLAEQFFTAFRQLPGGWKYKFEMLFVYLVFSSSLQLQILFFWSCKLFLLFWNLH